jgi:hypothetical protein
MTSPPVPLSNWRGGIGGRGVKGVRSVIEAPAQPELEGSSL